MAETMALRPSADKTFRNRDVADPDPRPALAGRAPSLSAATGWA
jgi:hypothetical protein